jgi:hypothetical protein
MGRLDQFHVADHTIIDESGVEGVVVELDRPKGQTRDKFAVAELTWTAEAMKDIASPGGMLINLMQYLSWQSHGESFRLSNEIVRQYGITRKTKYRVLERLEKTGRILVRRQNKQSPLVTLVRRSAK